MLKKIISSLLILLLLMGVFVKEPMAKENSFQEVSVQLGRQAKALVLYNYLEDCEEEKAYGLSYGGKTYYPLKELGELLGYNVKWDQLTRKISLEEGMGYNFYEETYEDTNKEEKPATKTLGNLKVIKTPIYLEDKMIKDGIVIEGKSYISADGLGRLTGLYPIEEKDFNLVYKDAEATYNDYLTRGVEAVKLDKKEDPLKDYHNPSPKQSKMVLRKMLNDIYKLENTDKPLKYKVDMSGKIEKNSIYKHASLSNAKRLGAMVRYINNSNFNLEVNRQKNIAFNILFKYPKEAAEADKSIKLAGDLKNGDLYIEALDLVDKLLLSKDFYYLAGSSIANYSLIEEYSEIELSEKMLAELDEKAKNLTDRIVEVYIDSLVDNIPDNSLKLESLGGMDTVSISINEESLYNIVLNYALKLLKDRNFIEAMVDFLEVNQEAQGQMVLGQENNSLVRFEKKQEIREEYKLFSDQFIPLLEEELKTKKIFEENIDPLIDLKGSQYKISSKKDASYTISSLLDVEIFNQEDSSEEGRTSSFRALINVDTEIEETDKLVRYIDNFTFKKARAKLFEKYIEENTDKLEDYIKSLIWSERFE